MRILTFLFSLVALNPAMAQDGPPSGLGLTQHGVEVLLEASGESYVAQLAPSGFTLTFEGQTHEVVAVTFGREGLFEMLDLPPETGLFGPGTGYAREEGPEAVHFMTDPLCASQYYGPGFNLLDDSRRTAAGYPVTALQGDSATRRCEVEGRLPVNTDLLGLVNPLYAVIRTDAGDTRLILRFVGS